MVFGTGKEKFKVIKTPGHGDILYTSLAIDNQLEYLTRAYNAIKRIAATVERPTTL